MFRFGTARKAPSYKTMHWARWGVHRSGQSIATSHALTPNGGLAKLVKYYIEFGQIDGPYSEPGIDWRWFHVDRNSYMAADVGSCQDANPSSLILYVCLNMFILYLVTIFK